MPIHDWTRVEAGDFHDFHQCWVVELRNALNRGLLPPDYMAMTDQVTGRPIPDVVALQTKAPHTSRGGGVALAPKPAPSARVVAKLEGINYTKRKNRVVIKHGRGTVVAIIEIVSPGNKDSRNSFRSFVEKAADVLNQGVNLFVVDVFPPTPRDPKGVHKAILDEFVDLPFDFLPEKPFTVASYLAGEDYPSAYVESAGLGDPLPEMPIFLADTDDIYVSAPLEETYARAWDVYPALLKELLEPPPAG
jgi:Protein of unknown function (DUF4058)